MYRAPVSEIAFTLKEVAGLADVVAQEGAGDLSPDLVDAILEEAGRFAAEEIAPLNGVGDKVGATLADDAVTMPPGWKAAYRAWTEGGWNALTGAPEFGGQGLPMMLHAAALEMWNSGSMAFAIGPTLTMGAVEALEKHATPELRDTYLPKLISGEWMGTMNLTEPQAGSDLNALRAKAERAEDGTYRIFGQKIYITYGEHDFTDNIVHLVLARLPDAPAGTRGISLFLVPKFLVNEDGSPGARNDVRCAGIEHKLGIHASPTCTMAYGDEGGAVGWLIGEENRGLACMFTMMNNARLSVGIQGLGVAERATQQALEYALERRQGRAPGETGDGMSPIAGHPDIKRSLLAMQAWTQVARSVCFCTAHALDMARLDGDTAVRARWSERAALLTPVAKALSTDIGVEVASIGVQVHGGMGYVEETGAAQHLRDARIAPIYEGTNGIQAIDLVARKLPLSGGETIRGLIAELDAIATAAKLAESDLGASGAHLDAAIAHLREAVDWLLEALADGRQAEALAGATPFLRLLGTVFGGAMLAKGALASLGDNTPAGERRRLLARYFAAAHLGEAGALKAQVLQASADVLAYDPAA
ncbi:acyl-CoA dehydrogenase [Stappia sp. ES.058]|uniref:acyl-CoA dehydrogenase n=1 Tax=Stappia sp. ES.058 TaxID=1881061 RepID=UPI00087BB02A|nr:acyl-CoA dehydrogenase [Stappia sp. ES.058]SDT93173.1 acyl-CoA dehydrogenase [Stappia sp. ES.058]